MPKHRALPPLVELQKSLEYDCNTGLFTWKETLSNRAVKGSIAGAQKDGYTLIRYNKRIYRAHRLAYYFYTGVDPAEMTIDHIDRNRSNNAIKNLRLATYKDQQGNRPVPVNNTSGYVGVSLDARRHKWYARLKGRHLGYFNTKEEAAAAYEKAATLYFDKFARSA